MQTRIAIRILAPPVTTVSPLGKYVLLAELR
jgi:hypothetical protein